MFSVGARVYVHSSSVISKKIGPKRHSLGYISNVEPVYFPDNIKNFPIPGQSFIVMPLSIAFTRFGREKRCRVEIKNFLNIVPISFIDGGCTKDTVDNILSLFSKGEFRNNKNWTSIIKDYNMQTIGTLFPVGCNGNMAMTDQNEAVAFIIAMLRNHSFGVTINHNRRLTTLNSVVKNSDLLSWVGNASKQIKTRISLLEWAKERQENMIDLLRIIQTLRAVFHKRAIETNFEHISSRVSQHRQVNFNKFTSWYTDGLLESKQLADRKAKIVNSESFGSASRALIDNMNIVRDTYLTHKPKYI